MLCIIMVYNVKEEDRDKYNLNLEAKVIFL